MTTTTKPTMQRGAVMIATTDGFKSLPGYRYGPFAIHKDPTSPSARMYPWSLTHLATGLRMLPYTVATMAEVKARADAVIDACDWSAVTAKNAHLLVPWWARDILRAGA